MLNHSKPNKTKQNLPIGKLVDPLVRNQAQLGRKVRTINANRIRGHHAHRVARHDHRDGDRIEFKRTRGGEEVRVKQLGEGDGLEQQNVALEGAEVDALAHIVRRDVSKKWKVTRELVKSVETINRSRRMRMDCVHRVHCN